MTQYTFDAGMATRQDCVIALRLHHEYVTKYSPRTCTGKPVASFYEANRSPELIDPLWRGPQSGIVEFSRIVELPAINQFEKPDWRLKMQGIVPQRVDRFWVSRLSLQELDYFPTRGDYVSWNGYRYGVLETILPPEAYWAQTNVWLGAVVRCVIIPSGDTPPFPNDVVLPIELNRPANG